MRVGPAFGSTGEISVAFAMLERELCHKDKPLAETAALPCIVKNSKTVFSKGEDERSS